MTDLNDIELRRLDFSILLLFRETLRTGKLTRAAERLGMTPSAASHGLGRLRRVFGDVLFLRRPHGLEPTEFARSLAPRIEMILAEARNALGQGRAFDVATVRRDVAIVASDMTLSLFAAPLLSLCRRHAPGLRLAFRAPAPGVAGHELRQGVVDLQIGPPTSGADLVSRVLYSERFRVIGRALKEPRLSLEDYLAAEHLLVAMDGSFRGVVDVALESLGLSRRVVASAPNFLAALTIIAQTDLLLTIPARLAQTHAVRTGLRHVDPPLDVRGYDVAISRARRERADPCLDWLSERIAEIAAAG